MIGRLVVLLLAANVAWFAWSQGWMSGIGLAPQVQAEPERLAQQLHPQALRVQPMRLPADASSRAPSDPTSTLTAASAPAAPASNAPPVSDPEAAETAGENCWQAGVFDERQAASLRSALAGLPESSWRMEEVQLPGRWMVYLGKLADASAVSAKRTELRALGVDTDRPGASLEPGLSLGRFGNEEAAERALSDLSRKGVRNARVVQERRDEPGYRLRLPHADDALRTKVRAMRGALAGRELRRCD